MIVYHYTSEESYNEIMKTKIFQRSNPWTTMDAAYGNGWYFTDLDPQKCNMYVSKKCWQNTKAIYRVVYYLQWEIADQILTKCRDNVYMLNNWEEKHIKFLGGGKNTKCPKEPCETCEEGKKYL